MRLIRSRPAIGVLFFLAASSAAAGEELRVDLPQAVEMAVGNSHLVKSAELEAGKAETDIRRALAEKYVPVADLKVETGVVPAARGTALNSEDEIGDIDNLGPFVKINLEIVQPLYSFGRLSSLERAAREGLAAAEAKHELTAQELSLMTIQTYWALALSRESLVLAEDLRKSFKTLTEEVKERLEDEDSEVDDGDLLEVRSSTYRIEKVFLDARENTHTARIAMKALLGTKEGVEIMTEETPSPTLTVTRDTFENHLGEYGVDHQGLEALEAASRALAAKIEYVRRDRYPLIFLGAGAGYARAPNRDDQTNPFVVDDFNYSRIGALVGMNWKPNIYKKNLEIEGLEKEHGALLEKYGALKRKLTVEAATQFGEAAKNRALLEAARESRTASRSWLRLSVDNWEMGIGEVKRLLDAYEAYYKMKGIEIEMELEYNLSLAGVASTLGNVELYLRWVEDGRMAL